MKLRKGTDENTYIAINDMLMHRLLNKLHFHKA